MEHSKLPWEVADRNENGDLYIGSADVQHIAIVVAAPFITNTKGNADFIVTACNEHDTLKAKAELFELMTKQMDELLGTVGDSLTNGMYHKCNNTLRIAKEIK